MVCGNWVSLKKYSINAARTPGTVAGSWYADLVRKWFNCFQILACINSSTTPKTLLSILTY